jgi:tRNA 2-selenouridine synthase
MKLLTGGEERVYLEDEGRLIGRLYLPDVLQEKMKEAPMAVVEQSMSQRIDVVVDDYVLDLGRRFTATHGEQGAVLHCEKMQADLSRIQKRLGGERYDVVSGLMTAAFEQQWRDGDLSLHREWVAALLDQYYDAMYDYQLSKRSGRIVFRGTREEVIEWVSQSA